MTPADTEAVRREHAIDANSVCPRCKWSWPCPTIQLADALEEAQELLSSFAANYDEATEELEQALKERDALASYRNEDAAQLRHTRGLLERAEAENEKLRERIAELEASSDSPKETV